MPNVANERTPEKVRCIAIAAMAAIVCSSGCQSPDQSSEPALSRSLHISDSRTYWQEAGFTKLVSPVRVPSNAYDYDSVEIWIRLPPSGTIDVVPPENSFVFPAGTIVDRVSYLGSAADRYVADVRGVTIEADNAQSFHVYLPQVDDEHALDGLEWDRDDVAANEAAVASLLDTLRQRPPAVYLNEEALQRFTDHSRYKQQCLNCHQFDRPEQRAFGERAPYRPTDASGLFTPLLVMRNSAPLEPHGLYDPNLREPYIDTTCTAGVLQPTARPSCSDGGLPLAHFDLGRALVDGSAHARAVCESRRLLYEHLDDTGRAMHRPAIDECKSSPESATSRFGNNQKNTEVLSE